MTTVQIDTSKSYSILIGNGLLHCAASYIRKLGNIRHICIVSDTNVFPLYGDKLTESLRADGFLVDSFVFPAGEVNKNAETYLRLLNFLAERRLTRSDLIIALGGGVVGDLAGFTAATYLRGIRFVQIPTTLLSAVDSSVGGKTAIDLPSGKNLAGCFYQPDLVICDTDTLSTLPESVFTDGCAEVIKYGILYDPAFFAYLEQTGPDFDPETVIRRCVELKRDAVTGDEFDTGKRLKLNLGHTFGHGVEAASHFTVSHGRAVAIGTAIISRACCCRDTQRILSLLNQFHLPVTTEFEAEELLDYILADKKRRGSHIKLIIPHAIGDCEIVEAPIDQIKTILLTGL